MEKNTFINALLDNHLDPTVYQDILKTHAREAIALVEYGNLSITNVGSSLINRIQFTEAEISPFHKQDIDCSEFTVQEGSRKASVCVFNDQKIDFLVLKKLLLHSFATDALGRRPYPSAGGLYAIEPLVFLFAERVNNFNSHVGGCYHFRPVSKKLQLIKPLSLAYFFDKLLHGYIKNNQLPCLGIMYLASISKAIFKYRYRGYRHALMEVGSMYQQAALCGEDLGLRNTVWSTFADQEMLYALDLDSSSYMPITMQFFGYCES